MDEYIKREDALKIIDNYSKAVTEEGKVVVDAIRDIIAVITPTADVVPKSEVEKALNEVELLIIIAKEAYKQQMEDAPNELSKQSKRTKWIAFEKFYEQFAELKKKHTEVNDDKTDNNS